jgi:hypothetical protein
MFFAPSGNDARSLETRQRSREWLESVSDFRRVDEVCGLLTEKGSEG